MRKRILLLLILLLTLTALPALAEDGITQYSVQMVQLDAATYQVHCEIEYTNRTGQRLSGVLFTMYANQLRRETTLVAETDRMEATFPGGYAPGGVEFGQITVDGEAADWGMQGEGEMFLRVGCDIAPGERAVFGFDYVLLIIASRGEIGFTDADIRLSGFLPGVAVWDDDEFVVNPASAIDRYAYHEPADYIIDMTVGDRYTVAAPGLPERGEAENGARTWCIEAQGVRDMAIAMSPEYDSRSVTSQMGTQITLLAWDKSGNKRAAETAQAAIDLMEGWFGRAPIRQMVIAEADIVSDGYGYSGLMLIPSERYDGGQKVQLERDIVFYLAQQFFGLGAGNDPVQAPWLSVSVPEMLYYQYIEAREGRENMLGQLNEDCLSALLMTLPGGFSVDTPLNAFTDSYDYDVVVRRRGAAAMYQIREAMGTETFLAGLREFYARHNGGFAGLQDFVAAFNAAAGREYDMLIVDWLYTISDYQGLAIDHFE